MTEMLEEIRARYADLWRGGTLTSSLGSLVRFPRWCHPIQRLDHWHGASKRRLDRDPVYLLVMFSVWASAVSATVTIPSGTMIVSHYIDSTTHLLISFCMLIGSSLCLLGSISGSRWFLPKVPIHDCYRYSVIGVPPLVFGLFIYGVIILLGLSRITVPLAGLAGPLIAVGDGIQGVRFWLERRRIMRTIPLIMTIESPDPLEPL